MFYFLVWDFSPLINKCLLNTSLPHVLTLNIIPLFPNNLLFLEHGCYFVGVLSFTKLRYKYP